MGNDMIEKWVDSSKSSIETFKNVIKSNMDSANNMMQKFLVNPASLAELTKASMSFTKELNELYSSTTVNLIKNQLNMANVQISQASFKEFGEIYGQAITSLVQKQKEMMNIYLENSVHYFDTLKKANNAEEFISVQSNAISELQEKVKKNMTETMMVFTQINTAMKIWVEKTLDELASSK
jgi:hypothetical protein